MRLRNPQMKGIFAILVPLNRENDFEAKSEKLFFRIFAGQHQKIELSHIDF